MAVKLSILIPAYNRPEHLNELLMSLANQNSEEIEIIVSDDCSPKKDEISKVCEHYRKSLDNFIYYKQDKNLGEVGNKNFLFKMASGKYLLYIGDDDLFKKGAIDNLLDLLKCHKNSDIFILGHIEENDHGKFSNKRYSIFSFIIPGKYLLDFGAINFDWFPFHFGHPASYMFRNSEDKKDIFVNNVGFAEDLAHLSFNLLENKLFFFTKRCFFKWRKDLDRNQTNQSNDNKLHLDSRILLLKYIRELSKNYSKKNFKLKERRFLYCKLKNKNRRYLIRPINIVGILFNYLQIHLFHLSYIFKNICKKNFLN